MTQLATITGSEFRQFQELIHRHTGIWLADHKRVMLESRLAKRLRHLNLDDFGAYYQLLVEGDPRGDELTRAINCVTTNKTEFFREPEHFDILSHWVQREYGKLRTRLWCAASSTGEEPYTLAMTMAEAAGSIASWTGSLVASDIDTDVLHTASAALYEESKIAALPVELRRKYFVRGTGEYAGWGKVRSTLRAKVEFRRLNLVAAEWPIDGPFDAIFCRNVLIYFNPDTQRHVISRMCAKLAPEGLLFVGHSENLHRLSDIVEPVAHGVYRLRGTGGRR